MGCAASSNDGSDCPGNNGKRGEEGAQKVPDDQMPDSAKDQECLK